MQEPQDKHGAFRSERWRLQQVRDIQEQKVRFFSQLEMVADDKLLRLKLHLPLAPEVKKHTVYENRENRHLVLRLENAQANRCLVWKLFPARSAGTPEAASNQEIEIRYLLLGRELLARSVCPHFVLPIGWCVLPSDDLHDILPAAFVAPRFNYVCLLAECCDMSLERLLRQVSTKDSLLPALMLQALLTLCILQDIFSSFRHNDAHAGNWLVQVLEQRAGYVRYVVLEQQFFLELALCPYRLHLWDFHFASVQAADANNLPFLVPASSELVTGTATSRTCRNAYYDLHTFVDCVAARCKQASPALHDFLNAVVPSHLRCFGQGTHPTAKRMWEIEHTTPRAALEHPIFDAFRTRPRNGPLMREYVYPVPLKSEQK